MLKTPGIRVLPIFYKVKPGDVGGSLGRARRAELLEQGCNPWVIEIWENDLGIAAELGGLEYKRNDERGEPEFQRLIVQAVPKWRNKALVSDGASEQDLVGVDLVVELIIRNLDVKNKALVSDGASEQDLVGVDLVAEQIIQNLDVKKVVMLGLWGVGGIGKTTLAWEIYSRLRKREYYSASCVKDVSEKVRQIDGVERVQGEIFKGLCHGSDALKVKDKIERKKSLEGWLCNHSPFLLLLDDVSNEKDMMEYIISSKMLEGGSMCIVTTRDRGVLEVFQRECDNVHIHQVGELSSEDSKRVFAYHAFGGDGKVMPGFETLVEGMSKACGGVPLVLKVIGSLLNGNDDMEAWQEILGSGNICKDHVDVYDRLRTSYDKLSRDQQEIFLDVACGLIGQSVDWAYRVWRSLKWNPEANVQLLVKRALVSLDNGGRFVMHDALRDMGCSIESGKEPEERARLWMPESLTKVKEKQLPKYLQTLVIDYCDWNMQTLDVLPMKELRILICNGSVKVTSIPTNLRWFSSSPHPQYIKMKMVSYDNYRITFPGLFQESKLVVLDLPWVQKCPLSCKQGHQPPCTVQGLGGQTALECLHLHYSHIDELPNLQQLDKLEELDISCSNIKSVPGLGHLLALVKFRAVGCFDLVELPDIGKLVRLQVLQLSRWTRAIPGLSRILPNLTELEINAEGLETLNVLKATKLLTLTVRGWSKHGPPAGSNFMALKSLTIYGSGSCTKKLDGLLEMKNLEDIFLCNFGLEDVSCLNYLTTLKSIHIQSCKSLEILPDLRKLTRLETLCSVNCYHFRE